MKQNVDLWVSEPVVPADINLLLPSGSAKGQFTAAGTILRGSSVHASFLVARCGLALDFGHCLIDSKTALGEGDGSGDETPTKYAKITHRGIGPRTDAPSLHQTLLES